MSGTTANKATQTSPVKTKKRSSSNKTAKTSTAGIRGSTTGANRKAATKKAASQKTAAKKPATRKVSKKAAGRKKTATGQHKAEQKQPIPASDNSTREEEKSLSWMSAQATSALRAVKASQAEKGQALLARTRKQAAAEQLDDDSLIKIAAGMPVDNEGLIEFSTEQPLEEQPLEEQLRKAEAVSPATAKPVVDERHEIADSSADMTPEPESTAEQALAGDALATPPAGQPQAVPAPSPPPPAKRSAVFQPVALAAGLVFAALLLGYYFWPDANDTPAIVATQESTEVEAPASAAEPDPAGPQGTTAEDVAAVPVVEAEEVAAVPVAQVEEVATAPIAEPELEPADRRNESIPAAVIPSSARSGQPQTATLAPAPEPEPAPAEPSPPVSYQAQQPVQPPAQPAKPAQPNYRTPVNGYYPQQRRPAYPQYYYR